MKLFASMIVVVLASLPSLSRGFNTVGRNSKFAGKVVYSTTSSQLNVATNFFETLQKNFFSTTTQGMNGSSSKYYTIAITGSSGVVGTALRDELSKRDIVNGKPIRIVQLKRSKSTDAIPQFTDEDTINDITVQWNPSAGDADSILDPSVVSQLDAVVHLAGENVATGLGPLGFLGIRPWTQEKKDAIMNSRVTTTSALANVISSSQRKITFLSASGVGIYGDNFIGTDSAAVDETTDVSSTTGFLPAVSRAWEGAALEASAAANRVVTMRFGVVMSLKGGALAKLYPIFLLGGGGIVGSGQQFFSFISGRDIARAIVHVLETPKLTGPVNLCSPEPCTNLEFTKALGKVINRPTILPFPSFAVQTLFGEMGNEMLLGGVRAVPTKLEKSGFEFLHPTIEEAISSAVTEKSI